MTQGWIHYTAQKPRIGERVLYCFCEPDHEYDSIEVEIGTWLGEMNRGGSLVMEQEGYGWYPGNYWMPIPAMPTLTEKQGE